ncbi:nitrile hydratase accessory protein [Pseudonocardia sp. C8]|nr:nitrile hydratase accessory protein [Pseudonocardia sp. C8]
MPHEPVFDAPWQAEAFAIAVALQDRGLLDRAEFAAALGARLAGGAAYWDAWLAALEALVTDRGLTDPGSLDARTAAWQRAAAATPHGSPVTLDADPQRP